MKSHIGNILVLFIKPGFEMNFNTAKDLQEYSNQLNGVKASEKYQAIFFDFHQNSDLFGCKLPCEKNSYPVDITTYHFNSILWEGSSASSDDNYYHLFFFYRSTTVQKQVEVLVYDLGGFLAAAGGNLGLCLGFSCLSIFFTITHLTKKTIYWLKDVSGQ